jgi:VWFA-related protein
MRRVALGVLLGLPGLVLSAGGQTATPAPQVFRTSVDMITLDVSVLDRDRRPVRGLSAADFTVLENGRPLKIVAFSEVALPDRLVSVAPWVNDVAPDVVTNRFEPDRLIVLLLDDWNVATNPADVLQTKRIAHAILDELGATDYAAVVYTFTHAKSQEFTTDKAKLREAVDRFTSSHFNDPPTGPTLPSMACPHNECVTAALRAVSDVMRDSWPGRRKAIAYISPEGRYTVGPQSIGASDTGLTEPGESANIWDSGPDLARTFRALQMANVNVYQYDPRGLADALTIEIKPNTSSVMGMFADATGGRIVTRTNAPAARVGEMIRETSAYYMLGVEPSAAAGEAFRPVTVRVSNPDLTVRSRTGYFRERLSPDRAAERRSPPVDHAMTAARTITDLPLSLTAAPFATPTGGAVAVVAGLDRTPDMAAADTIEIAARAFDQARGDRLSRGVATARLQLSRNTNATRPVHYDLGNRLDLPPGRYEVRVVASSGTTGTIGSVLTYVTVPDFAKQPFTASGLVLAHVPFRRATGRDPLGDLLPFTPTTVRTFREDDEIAAVMRLYQAPNHEGPIDVVAEIRNDADAVVVDHAEQISADRTQRTPRTSEYRLDVPLASLDPGEYLLAIQATSGAVTVTRQLRFRVE